MRAQRSLARLAMATLVVSSLIAASPALGAGWAVGTAGTILKSTDAGASWTLTNPTTNDFQAVHFVDDNTGWAVGTTGAIYKTTNAGTSWTAEASGTTATLNGVFFINSTTGWAAGTGGTILKTINGGTSWTLLTSSTTATLNGVFFIDANTGWAAGTGGTILKTINGGTSWTLLASSTTAILDGVFFVDVNNGWAVGTSGTILKTANGGTSWTLQTSGTTATLNSVFFISGTTGWTVGTSGTILKTVNGGSSWTLQTSSTGAILNGVYFLDANTGWAVGTSGTILKTINGGSSWTLQTSGSTATLYGVRFVGVSVTVTTNPVGRSFTVDGTPYTASQTFTWIAGSSHGIATTSPQAGVTGTQYVWTTWSDAGALSHTVAPTTGTTYTANFTTQYLLTMNAGTGGSVSPASGYRNSSSMVSISATPSAGHVFSGWSGTGTGSYSGSSNPASITMNGPITETGTFSPTITATVGTNPSGRSFTVDGTAYTSAQTFSWVSGSSHNIVTTSPQAGAAGTQYVWTSWSDAGAISHMVAPVSNTTYTANFTTQYLLTMNAGAGGSVSPPTAYHDASSIVAITAAPGAGYSFTGWAGSGTGSYTGSSNPGSVTMNAPITETGSFVANASVTVGTNRPGLSFSVDGVGYNTTQGFNWTPGSSHIIAVGSPQSGSLGTQYVWTDWSDAGAISHTVAPSGAASYTANFKTQFALTMAAGIGGTVTPSSGWEDSSVSIQIEATPTTGAFHAWFGTGPGSYSGIANPVTITMDGPVSDSAAFAQTDGVEDRTSTIPSVFFLGQNQPNPVLRITAFAFGLPRGGRVSLRVFDVRGRLISTLEDGPLPAGVYRRVWDTRDLSGQTVASGVYYARLQMGADVRMRRVVVIR